MNVSSSDKKDERQQEKRLFAALKKSNKAVSDNYVSRCQMEKYFKGKTRSERNAYFTKHGELKRESHEAFLNAFPRLKAAASNEYTELSKEEQRRLLEDEYIKTQHEIHVSALVYGIDCDAWEDVFRANVPQLEQKCEGIRTVLESLMNIDDDDDPDATYR